MIDQPLYAVAMTWYAAYRNRIKLYAERDKILSECRKAEAALIACENDLKFRVGGGGKSFEINNQQQIIVVEPKPSEQVCIYDLIKSSD